MKETSMPNNFGGDQHDPDYNPDASKASRKQRIVRIQMKKQTQKPTKVKKAPRQTKEATKWFDHARTLPLALFHTTAGQIIGRIEKVTGPDAGAFNVRVWAPAVIRMGFESMQPGATSMNSKLAVTFNTIALVETYIDLSAMTPFGRSPVPDALVPSYEQYFDRVVAGDYAFNRVVQHVEQALPHSAPVTSTEPAEPAPEPVSLFPWPEGEDYYTWLTRKVYSLAEDEAVDRDDIRRVLIKRALLGWAFGATPQKVASSFDFDAYDVMFAYGVFNQVLPSDKQHTQRLFPPESNVDESKVLLPGEENTTS